MPTSTGSESTGRRRSFIEGLLQKRETDDRDQGEPVENELHSLPNGIYSIEAMRFPNLYLDAHSFNSKTKKGDIRLTLEEDDTKFYLGADNGELWGWAFFRARRVENVAETYVFESMRWPGSYLLASDMGNGYLTKSYGVVRLAQMESDPSVSTNDNDVSLAAAAAAANESSATMSAHNQKAMACWHVLTSVPGSECPHTYTWASAAYSQRFSGFGGGHTWYLDAYSRSGKGRGKVRYVKVEETDDTATNGAGPQAFTPAGKRAAEDILATAARAGGSAAVAGLSGTVDFEKEILLSLHAAGSISDSELVRREQEVTASYYRWNWFRFRQYYISLVFTDIQGSTRLWERFGPKFKTIIDMHHRVLRTVLKRHHGYEVKTEGDAFMIVFTRPADAVLFGTDLQIDLLEFPWPDWMLEDEVVKDCVGVELNPDGSVLWRGLRVRVGCYSGAPDVERDEVTKRMDFYGPAVNRAARVEGQADGGQFLICETTYLHTLAENGSAQDGGELTSHLDTDPSLREALTVVDCGVRELKGIALPEHVYQVLPNRLKARDFGTASSTAAATTLATVPVAIDSSAPTSAAPFPDPPLVSPAVALKADALLAPSYLSQSSSMSECPPEPPLSTPPPYKNNDDSAATRMPPPAADASPSAATGAATSSASAVASPGGRRKLTSQPSHIRQPTPLVHGKEGGAGGKLGLLESSKGGGKTKHDTSSSNSSGSGSATTPQSHPQPSTTTMTPPLQASFDVSLVYHPPDAHVLCALLHEFLRSNGYQVAPLAASALGSNSSSSDNDDALRTSIDAVRASRCAVVVLSSHCFIAPNALELESTDTATPSSSSHPYFYASLNATISSQLPLITLRQEGATWNGSSLPDLTALASSGPITYSDGYGGQFDDATSLLRELFRTKPLEHSCEYFEAFCNRLLLRLPLAPSGNLPIESSTDVPPAASATAEKRSGAVTPKPKSSTKKNSSAGSSSSPPPTSDVARSSNGNHSSTSSSTRTKKATPAGRSPVRRAVSANDVSSSGYSNRSRSSSNSTRSNSGRNGQLSFGKSGSGSQTDPLSNRKALHSTATTSSITTPTAGSSTTPGAAKTTAGGVRTGGRSPTRPISSSLSRPASKSPARPISNTSKPTPSRLRSNASSSSSNSILSRSSSSTSSSSVSSMSSGRRSNSSSNVSGNSSISSGASGKSSSGGSSSGKFVKVSPSRPGRASVVLAPLAAAAAAAAALTSEGSSDNYDEDLQGGDGPNHDREQLSFSLEINHTSSAGYAVDQGSLPMRETQSEAIATAETMMARTAITAPEDPLSGASNNGSPPTTEGDRGRNPGRGRPGAPRRAAAVLRSDKGPSANF